MLFRKASNFKTEQFRKKSSGQQSQGSRRAKIGRHIYVERIKGIWKKLKDLEDKTQGL